MTAKWKRILWISGAMLLAVVASVVFIENRGGHYPIQKASSFSDLPLFSNFGANELKQSFKVK